MIVQALNPRTLEGEAVPGQPNLTCKFQSQPGLHRRANFKTKQINNYQFHFLLEEQEFKEGLCKSLSTALT